MEKMKMPTIQLSTNEIEILKKEMGSLNDEEELTNDEILFLKKEIKLIQNNESIPERKPLTKEDIAMRNTRAFQFLIIFILALMCIAGCGAIN